MSNINESIKFWEKHRDLEIAARTGRKDARSRAASEARELVKDVRKFLPLEVVNWCQNYGVTDASTDADIIGAVVEWTAELLRTTETAANRFHKYAESSGLVDAIAWCADDVAKEYGENKTKAQFVNVVRYQARQNDYAVPFIQAVIAAGNELLREMVSDSMGLSTSAGHNLVDTYKAEGRRLAARAILSLCDRLSKIAQIW